MECCYETQYDKVLNLNPDSSGNMYYRGDWKYNPEYNTGDVVIFSGKLYLARMHNAGKDPSRNPEYWQKVGIDLPKPPKPPSRTALYGGVASLRDIPQSCEIQLRIDSALNWEATNPRLGLGEAGIDITHHKFKVGNGIDNWNTLPYMNEDVYGLIEEEAQTRADEVKEITHKIEDDELATIQAISDLKHEDRQIRSSIITLDHKRLAYETRLTSELSAEHEELRAELSELSAMRDMLNARLDAVIGQFTEDVEVLDARVDVEHETYPTAGANIRNTQTRLRGLHDYTKELQGQIDEVSGAVLTLATLVKGSSKAQEDLNDYIRHEEQSRLEDREYLKSEVEALSGVIIGVLLSNFAAREREEARFAWIEDALAEVGYIEDKENLPATDREITEMLDDIFTGNVPSGDSGVINDDDTATDEEFDEMLEEVFGS